MTPDELNRIAIEVGLTRECGHEKHPAIPCLDSMGHEVPDCPGIVPDFEAVMVPCPIPRKVHAHGPLRVDWPATIASLMQRLAQAEEVVEAAREWDRSKEWASQNPEKLLSSRMTSQQAAEVMREYFDKEKALRTALSTYDGRTP